MLSFVLRENLTAGDIHVGDPGYLMSLLIISIWLVAFYKDDILPFFLRTFAILRILICEILHSLHWVLNKMGAALSAQLFPATEWSSPKRLNT